MVRARRFLYIALLTLVAYAVIGATAPLPEQAIFKNHQYALVSTGEVKADFVDMLPLGEVVRVTVNVTRGGPIDVHLVQMNETYDDLFESGAYNATVPIPGIVAYSALEVTNYTFAFESDGFYQYAVFLDNRRYSNPDGDPLDDQNATFVVVRTRFTEERERAAVLVGLLTTVPAILLPLYTIVRKARMLRRSGAGPSAAANR